MTDQPDLRAKIVALFHDGYLYEKPPSEIGDAVMEVVEPVVHELLWLHAEADWWLNLSRDEHEADEQLHVWFKRCQYAEGRLAKVEASRRDWAAEAVGLQDELDTLTQPLAWEIAHPFEGSGCAMGDPNCDECNRCDICGTEPGADIHQPQQPDPLIMLCVCPTEKQAADLVAAGFSLPQCNVHPRGDSDG